MSAKRRKATILAATQESKAPELGRYATSAPGAKAKAPQAPGEIIEYAAMENVLGEDWLVRQALRFSSNLILSLIGDYEHPDDDIRDLVRRHLHSCQRWWRSALLGLLEGMWYGFSVSILNWDPAPSDAAMQGEWVIRSFQPVAPKAVFPDGFDISKGLQQDQVTINKGSSIQATVPGERIVHWAFESAWNPYGTPLARNIWMLAQARRDGFRWWLTGLERLGQPMIVEIVQPGTYLDAKTGEQRRFMDDAAESWNATSGGSVIIRSAADKDGKLPKVEALSVAGWNNEFKEFFGYVDRAVFLGFGIPPLLMMEPEHSSRAQASVNSELTSLSMMPIAEEFAQSVMVEQIVRRIIEYNRGPQETYGSFPTSMPVDEEELVGIIEGLARTGTFGVMPMSYYGRIQELFPNILPPVDEIEEMGRGLPAGVE